MEKLRIRGGAKLHGTVRISGAKNAALPAMTAALLTGDTVHLNNIPRVRDIVTMGRLLTHMNAKVEMAQVPSEEVCITAQRLNEAEAPYELVKTMRASILTLGPLAGRLGRARVSLPGGCAIGARPVDLHLKALEEMGAEIITSSGYIEARAPKGGKLRGARIKFEKITVTGTENILMAASLADGETIIENAAREPEVTDLVELLRKMGAKISGDGTSELRVEGVRELHGAEHSIIPDRIEAGTFIIAGAITGGEIEMTNCTPEHLESIIAHLADAGVQVERNGTLGSVRVRVLGKLHAVNVRTEEYPGFATDMQAQFMALMTQAEGKSDIIETIFENRFMHASEMIRMGADISIGTHVAIVNGPTELQGTTVIASDLRASAGLVLAALVARGDTIIDRVYHIDRGYERIEAKLAALGAQIERVS
jgi:UDP-N-acetylglucosamine 1-carboxyvinyltransferase